MGFKNGHALVIGVGNFVHHSEYDVPITVRDADAIHDILIDPERCAYPAEQVTMLKESAATRANIIQALEGLASRTTERDTIFLYFCSHGDFGTDGEWYFKPHDVRVENKKVVPETGLGNKTLIQLFKNLPAKRVFVVFNTCFSGSLSPDALGGEADRAAPELNSLGPDSRTLNAILGSGEGRIIITAAGEDQKSWFLKKGTLTFFTKAIVDGFSGELGIRPRNGAISAFDLYNEVFFEVTGIVNNLGVTQEPEITVIKGVGPFAVALAKGEESGSLGSLSFEAAETDLTSGKVREIPKHRAERAMQQFMDNSTTTNINSGGGAVFQGDVSVTNGDFVGRDRIDNSTTTTHNTTNTTTNDNSRTIGNVGGGSTIVQGDGNVTVGAGGVSVGGNNTGNIVTGNNNQINQNTTTNQTFAPVYAQIQARDDSTAAFDNEMVKGTVKQIEEEASKPDGQIQEGVLHRTLDRLKAMAPDILETVITTAINPAAGLTSIAQKIFKKYQTSQAG